jgi:hypothetical protein
MTEAAALKKIRETKKQAEGVRELLRQCGQRDEAIALTHRYSEVMSAPVDMSAPEEAERRGELMMAVSELMGILQKEFLR